LDAWGIPTEPFAPANMGFNVTWSDHMTCWFGHPVKGVTLHAGDLSVPGEFVISRSGVEGSAIYAVSKALREGAPLTVDLRPGVALSDLRDRWAGMPRKLTATARLKRLGLSGVQIVLVQEFARPLSADPAPVIKALPIPHTGPRLMDEAISTAGGVRWDALDDSLMLHARPGVFCAGEMLDWEAPTGGYLITGCLATGAWAGAAAARYAA
ncbi:MAG: NAD(P)/FAD-dependent oxidoreductase, partial [Pseudomonadota bacterium]